MSLLLRSRPPSPASAAVTPATLTPAALAPASVPVPVPALAGAELSEDELEQVVGGLERVYVPGLVIVG